MYFITPLVQRCLVSFCITILSFFTFVNYEVSAKNYQKSEDALAAIPLRLQTQLRKRLKLMIKYQGQRKWNKMYDLMAASILKGTSKEEFVKEQTRSDIDPDVSSLIDFSPEESVLTSKLPDAGPWVLLGCAEYKRHGKTVHMKAGLSAELENGKWFFSEIAVRAQVDGSEEPCKFTPTKRRH